MEWHHVCYNNVVFLLTKIQEKHLPFFLVSIWGTFRSQWSSFWSSRWSCWPLRLSIVISQATSLSHWPVPTLPKQRPTRQGWIWLRRRWETEVLMVGTPKIHPRWISKFRQCSFPAEALDGNKSRCKTITGVLLHPFLFFSSPVLLGDFLKQQKFVAFLSMARGEWWVPDEKNTWGRQVGRLK